MTTVKYGEWEIAVDRDMTAKYYASLTVSDDSQAYRNFAKNCETMPDEERAFFDSFSVPPQLCRVDEPIGRSRNGTIPTGGYFLVFGRYTGAPKEMLITPEELAASDFEPDIPDPRISIGAFQFDFQYPDHMFSQLPDDMPEGTICVRFWCEELPWRLDEKCELELFELPRFWEVGRKIRIFMRNRRENREYMTELKADIARAFTEAGISFCPMTSREIKKYKKTWLSSFAPEGSDMRELRGLCFGGRKFGNGYLWHLFSFEIVRVPEPEESDRLFDSAHKDRAVLIDNWNGLGYRISSLSKLDSEFISSHECFIDVTVTAEDFSWTYSKTHEEGMCGPYFYE